MSAAAVTVVDRVPYSAMVSPEQALAYCRRVLKGWAERNEALFVCFDPPAGHAHEGFIVAVPKIGEAKDFAREIGLLCVDLVETAGIASKPSDVLRAMAQEPPPGGNYCPTCDKREVITDSEGRHVKCGGPVIVG